MNIPSSIFKAYDIRGIVETELTPEIVKLIGKAVGSESIEKGERDSLRVDATWLI
jgi:phosphomannomutase/phosphoglucomutase